jgi:hypothetical protein
VGLKRSGNHAVINWIGQQFPGDRVYFLNNCRPLENPYNTKHSEDSAETIIFHNYRINRHTQRFDDKDCLLYSYENRSLSEVHNEVARNNHDAWVGQSLNRYDILLLRDPFNLIASCLQRDLNQGQNEENLQDRYLRLKSLWIEYAREFIGETNYLLSNKTVISFNSWKADKAYRRQLAENLGLEFTDAAVDEVLPVGGGSSFDERQFDGAGGSMELGKRWCRFRTNVFYRNLLRDGTLWKLSKRIFGPIPGTDEWIASE